MTASILRHTGNHAATVRSVSIGAAGTDLAKITAMKVLQHSFRSFLFVLIASVAAVGVASPQDETDGTEVVGGLSFRDEVELTVVNIDVFVTDKDGNAVTDLTVDDFQLLQDKQPRPISHFAQFNEVVISTLVEDEVGLPVPAPTPTAVAEEPETTIRAKVKPVYIVLFVDNENIRAMDRNRVLGQIRRFLDDIMYPHVQVMVVSYQRSLKVLQEFTSDRREVADALRAVRTMTAGRSDTDKKRKEILRSFASIRQSGQRPSEFARMQLENDLRSYAENVSNELGFAINAVREVTGTLTGLQGRKYLIHVSSGIPMVPGKDLFNEFSSVFQNRSTLALESRFDHRRHFRNLASAANSQGVTFYTIDASGLGGAGSTVSAEYAGAADPITAGLYVINQQEPLFYIAERTGGRAIVSANDVTEGLGRFRQDLFAYYSLGYTIPGSGADTVHHIEVRLPEHPGYELNYRRTFVEKSLESKIQDRVMTGLSFDIDENPMGLTVETGTASPAPNDRSMLPVKIGFPLDSIALIPEGEHHVGRVVAFVAVRDEKGRQSELQRRQHEIRIPNEDLEAHGHDRYVIELSLLIRTGRSRIVVALMDEVTRQASYATSTQNVAPGT